MKESGVLALFLIATAASAQAREPRLPRESAANCAEYYARAYQVPVEFVDAVIEAESGWNPYAISSKGAVGLMQLMPATAVRLGVRNRFRIDENVHAGVAYLAWLIRFFHGDLRLASAAYFVGESSIRSRGLKYSSPEAYSYVRKVARLYRAKRLAAVRIYQPAAPKQNSRR